MIILIFGGILEGIKRIGHWVHSAVKHGIGVREAEELIGPLDRTVDATEFRQAYDAYQEARSGWQQIRDIPEQYKIAEEFSATSPFDWRQQHIMKMKIHGTDLNTGEQIEQWITVESDNALSKSEWLNLADNAVSDSPFGYSYDIDYVSDYEYYQKGI